MTRRVRMLRQHHPHLMPQRCDEVSPRAEFSGRCSLSGALMHVRPHYSARSVALALAALLVAGPSALTAQTPADHAPAVGDMAPDFTLPASRGGRVLAQPLKLSDYRGKTVVLAFYPKSRTSGCTVQMEAYRDRYAKLFHGGKDVTLISISADDAPTQASWATDEKFSWTFASDAGGAVGTQYGTFNPEYKLDMRTLYI